LVYDEHWYIYFPFTMRITGGENRGRNIVCPSGKTVRPTASKVRQALFNILGAKIIEAKFLDICAGTGLVGLEALSRGAAALTSVEQNKAMAAMIESSGRGLGYEVKVFALDFREAMKALQGGRFDIIYADPPYKSEFAQVILQKVPEYELLAQEGLLIVEHLNNITLEASATPLTKTDRRTYGQTILSFFASYN
jgi:16S rRNA (guanine966-N2)-methyltransferase